MRDPEEIAELDEFDAWKSSFISDLLEICLFYMDGTNPEDLYKKLDKLVDNL